jgi:hypothetical protein
MGVNLVLVYIKLVDIVVLHVMYDYDFVYAFNVHKYPLYADLPNDNPPN